MLIIPIVCRLSHFIIFQLWTYIIKTDLLLLNNEIIRYKITILLEVMKWNHGYRTAKEKIRVRNNRNYGYEMTENYGYEMARVRNDWLPINMIGWLYWGLTPL